MSEFLDKTGLSYLWSKIKAKLNNKANESEIINIENQLKYKVNRNELNRKADLDQYAVINISTHKFKFDTPLSQNYYKGSLDLLHPDQNNFQMSLFPSGYTEIVCILAVEFAYFENEEKYNNNDAISVVGNYSVLPISIQAEGQTNSTTQKWSFFEPNNKIDNMYGGIIFYTLLIKKPLLPVG